MSQCQRPLTILLAVLTMSPKKQRRGRELPITDTTALPTWNPTRMSMAPMLGSSSRIRTSWAALTASIEKRAIRATKSGCGSG